MLIKNGTIIDGTKRKGFKGDIRIEDDKIKEVGNIKLRKKERFIDAKGQFVTPGFIDIINRSDIHYSIFERPGLPSLIKQGITTIIGGGCGTSLAPLANKEAIRSIQKWHDISRMNINWATTGEFLDEVERHHISTNFATLTGHATLRRGVVGDYFEDLSEDDTKKMEYLLASSMEEGSFGLSTGLAYSHEKIAPLKELDRLVKVVKDNGGIYATHLRDESSGLVASVEETIALSAKHNVSSHIFHFKAFGREAWAEFPKVLEMINQANEEGASIDFDMYPYSRTASVLYLLLPDWVTRGGKIEVLKKLRDKSVCDRIKDEMHGSTEDFAKIVIAGGNIDSIFLGKSLGDIAKNQGGSAIDALLNLILASQDQIIGFIPTISEQNIEMGIKNNFGFIGSDGAGYKTLDRKEGLVHPRSFGAFPRYLKLYILKKNILSWEDAIYKITSMPAEKIGLKNRGKIKKGYFADIVIFDPQSIRDRATFKDPFQYSEGLNYVIVNGGLALRRGKLQKKRWGRVLKK